MNPEIEHILTIINSHLNRATTHVEAPTNQNLENWQRHRLRWQARQGALIDLNYDIRAYLDHPKDKGDPPNPEAPQTPDTQRRAHTQRRTHFLDLKAATRTTEIFQDLRDSDQLAPFQKAEILELMLLSDLAEEKWGFPPKDATIMIGLLHYYGQLQIAEAGFGIAENG